MLDLKCWLKEQSLSAKELSEMLQVPLPTVEDWVYKGAVPKPQNLDTLNNFIAAICAHHWVINRPNGPMSEGVCQRCGEIREFTNSTEPASMWTMNHRPKGQ